MEYLVRREGEEARWGSRPSGLGREAKEQRKQLEEEGAEGAAETAREMLGRKYGGAWLWLATEAPMAVGMADRGELVEEARRRGVELVKGMEAAAGKRAMVAEVREELARREAGKGGGGEGREGGERAVGEAMERRGELRDAEDDADLWQEGEEGEEVERGAAVAKVEEATEAASAAQILRSV